MVLMERRKVGFRSEEKVKGREEAGGSKAYGKLEDSGGLS